MTASARTIPWGSQGREVVVLSLGDDSPVAYSWTCYGREDIGQGHEHSIGCLWVWHDCDHHVMIAEAEAAIARGEPRDIASIEHFIGWTPTGVGAHTLHNPDPLHIEASVYWPTCCGLHGFIREGKWVPC